MPVLPLVIGQLISKNVIGFLDNPWFVFYKKLLNKQKINPYVRNSLK